MDEVNLNVLCRVGIELTYMKDGTVVITKRIDENQLCEAASIRLESGYTCENLGSEIAHLVTSN